MCFWREQAGHQRSVSSATVAPMARPANTPISMAPALPRQITRMSRKVRKVSVPKAWAGPGAAPRGEFSVAISLTKALPGVAPTGWAAT